MTEQSEFHKLQLILCLGTPEAIVAGYAAKYMAGSLQHLRHLTINTKH